MPLVPVSIVVPGAESVVPFDWIAPRISLAEFFRSWPSAFASPLKALPEEVVCPDEECVISCIPAVPVPMLGPSTGPCPNPVDPSCV